MQQHDEAITAPGFGPDEPVVTYERIAAQVRAMRPRALTPSQFDDVVVMIEWMRGEALRVHGLNEEAATALAARELEVSRRERDVGIRHRTIAAVVGMQAPRHWLRFFNHKR